MSDNQPVVFDQAALVERIRTSVRSSIGMLIPEEQWSGMIEKEIVAFFEQPTDNWAYTDVMKDVPRYADDRFPEKKKIGENISFLRITPFRAIVWSEITAIILPLIKQALDLNAAVSEQVTTMEETPRLNQFGYFVTEMLPKVHHQLTEEHRKKLEAALPSMLSHLLSGSYQQAASQASAHLFGMVNDSVKTHLQNAGIQQR